jgi:CheY-like chemotaxis protein
MVYLRERVMALKNNSLKSNSIKILLVEDDFDDIELLEDALSASGVPFVMDTVTEGNKVSPFLDGCAELPDVLVLDFNLPKKHGREILQDLRASKKFAAIPVVVLTTSSQQADKDYAEAHGVRHYITKPTTTDGFKEAVEKILSVR